MSLEFVIILFILFMVVKFIYNRIRRNIFPDKGRVRSIFREVSSQYELTYVKGSLFELPMAYGTSDGFRLSFVVSREAVLANIVLEVSPVEKTYFRLVAMKRTGASSSPGTLGSGGFVTGDPDFDKVVLLDGNDTSTAAALLCKRTRALIYLLQWRAAKFEVTFTRIAAVYPLGYFIDRHMYVFSVIPMFIELAKRLSIHENDKDCLMRNATTDPLPAVRAVNLRQLLTYPAFDDDIRAVFEKSLRDASVDVVAAAVAGLGEEYADRLEPFLSDKDFEVRIRAVNGVAAVAAAVDTDRYIAIYESERNERVRISILDLFRKTGQNEAQDFLVSETESDVSEIRLHAIMALATCGNVSVVQCLYELSECSNDKRIKSEASRSMESIQKRFGVKDKGGLSLSGDSGDSGVVSLGEDGDDGSLSVFDDEE